GSPCDVLPVQRAEAGIARRLGGQIRIYLTLKEWDKAVSVGKENVRLNPGSAEAHNLLAGALQRKGQLDAAIAEYREAIRLDSDHHNLDNVRLYNHGEVHLRLGNVLKAKGKLDDAIAEYRMAIKLVRIALKPELKWDRAVEAHTNLGITLMD